MDAAERLVTSTQDLLWERGYSGTSPKAIQERAVAGQGSMYHHFAGKSELALTAIRRSAEQVTAESERSLSSAGTALERVLHYLRRDREVLRGCRMGRLTQDSEVIADDVLRQPVSETFERLQQRLTQVISDGQKNGEIGDALDPEDTASMIAAVIQGGYVLACAAQSPEPFHRAVNGAAALLSSTVGPTQRQAGQPGQGSPQTTDSIAKRL